MQQVRTQVFYIIIQIFTFFIDFSLNLVRAKQTSCPFDTFKYHVSSTDGKISVVLYCIVFYLMGWSLLSNALRPFKIYFAPPNLGITRT